MFSEIIAKKIQTSYGFKKYFKHVSWNLFGRFASMISGFLVTAYVVRYLGPTQNGQLAYAATMVGLVSFIAGLGIDGILYRDLISNPEKRDTLLGTAFVLKVIGALLSLILLILMMFLFKNETYVNWLIIILWLPLLLQGFFSINLYFQGNLQSKIVTLNYLTVTFFVLILKVVFVTLGLSLIWFAFLTLIETIFYVVGYVYIYWKSGLNIMKWRFDKALVKPILISSWPLILSTVFTVIYSRIDQVMLNHYLGYSAVGIYDVSVRISELWYIFPSVVIGSLFPAMVNIKKSGNKEAYRRRMIYLYSFVFYLSIVVILPMTLLSEQIVMILYGKAFIEAASVLKIYAWAGVFIGLATVINQFLINENQTKILFVLNFFSMVGNVVLNLFLIPKIGMVGAALATLISYSFLIVGVVFFRKTRGQIKLISHAILLKNIIYGK